MPPGYRRVPKNGRLYHALRIPVFQKGNGGRNVIFNRRYISNRKIAVVGNGFVFGVFLL